MNLHWRILVFVVFSIAVFPVNAFDWQDLWLNKNQKAMRLLKDDPAQAAKQFDDSQWQGVGEYKAGNFESALEHFSKSTSPNAKYNQGNALARAGKLDDALSVYDDLLAQEILDETVKENAQFNRDLVKKLLEQQQQQQSQQGEDGENSEDGEQQNSEESSENSSSSDPQDGSESSSDTENEGSQSQEESQSESDSNADQSESTSQDDSTEKNQDQDSMNSGQRTEETPVSEDEQATEQWLRKIPEDPTGLLRRKLDQTHRSQYPQIRNGGQPW